MLSGSLKSLEYGSLTTKYVRSKRANIRTISKRYKFIKDYE